MFYKTILVHLNDKRRAEAFLQPALALASRHNAHLIGLHVNSGIYAPPVPMPYGKEILGAMLAAERKETEEIAAIFARMTANQPVVAEWRAVQASHADLGAIVMDHGRCADLIIAGQTDPDWDNSPVLDFPERLVMESGRPVLLIPYVGRYPDVGRNAVIAWKPTRESARAVFDSLPLLREAQSVHILEVSESSSDSKSLAPDTSIAAALGRHGLKPVVRTSIAADISVGDEILSRIADLGADLLVMGAYGHSRLREFVFGGVTRHIAKHMTVPTLFSH